MKRETPGAWPHASEGLQLGLHSDMVSFPEPFPYIAQFCNVTWLLSDYTKDNGALAFVPGSHRLCRQPLSGESVRHVVPVEAPKGSLVVWHANTWRGSYPRVGPGLRTGIAYGLAREYVHPLEPVRPRHHRQPSRGARRALRDPCRPQRRRLGHARDRTTQSCWRVRSATACTPEPPAGPGSGHAALAGGGRGSGLVP